MVGDRIVEIDGEDARGMTTEQISAKLRGEAGTKVKLKVGKFYGGDIVPLEIRREVISIPGIPYYGMLNDSIGYILNIDFTEDVNSDMRTAVMSLAATGVPGHLCWTTGNNGGGIVQEAVKILSFFVPRGTEVVSMRGRNLGEAVNFVTQSEPIAPDMPLVVLVNNATASSAEIVAGALQDLDRRWSWTPLLRQGTGADHPADGLQLLSEDYNGQVLPAQRAVHSGHRLCAAGRGRYDQPHSRFADPRIPHGGRPTGL